MAQVLQIISRGPFSLSAAAGFGFGPTDGHAPEWDGAMRLCFALDGGRGYAGAVLRQAELNGPVSVELQLQDGGELDVALAQVARIVSLDHDGREFVALGESDPVLGALQHAHPGQRPVLFPSPYEAAAWSVISARRPAAQGAKVRAELGARYGATFELAGSTLLAFPQPEQLAELDDEFPGLNDTKLERLRGVARAALDGDLDVARLHQLGPERGYEDVQRLSGIGPFYAGLIVLRASGFADAWVGGDRVPEPKGAASAARYYGLGESLTAAQLGQLAERWRPFRTWALVLIRLAGARGTTV
ncbi:MAG: DNA-3-methyladenine glycosylase family protein [Solirubrobacteraceae bacterium]